IVKQHLDSGPGEALVEPVGGLTNGIALAIADRCDRHLERGHGGRPDDPPLVVILLDRRRDGPRKTDAIAAPYERLAPPVLVDEAGVHVHRVLGPERKNVAHLDAPGEG